MSLRWTKAARVAVEWLILEGKTKRQIEKTVGLAWHEIVERLTYHARQEALAERRRTDPAYAHLAITKPLPTRAAPQHAAGPLTDEEAVAVAELYKPKVALPPRLRKYAGKSYG